MHGASQGANIIKIQTSGKGGGGDGGRQGGWEAGLGGGEGAVG